MPKGEVQIITDTQGNAHAIKRQDALTQRVGATCLWRLGTSAILPPPSHADAAD